MAPPGDGQLRELAAAENVECHGALWFLWGRSRQTRSAPSVPDHAMINVEAVVMTKVGAELVVENVKRGCDSGQTSPPRLWKNAHQIAEIGPPTLS
jgi:hypothetical protein